MTARQAAMLRRRLLAWYAAKKRDLPWRRTSDPYRIWISEIMLQQTRVAAVIPYYEQFIAQFPTVQALAKAPAERVLRQWAGLGYYGRARNLHRAAKEIVSRHQGKFQDDLEAALALPGIGSYTAAAVLSIAYGKPLAVLDGNVARVLARLGAVGGDLRAPANWRTFVSKSQELLDRDAPGDWNQAMMELGATVCTPKSPKCGECPVALDCRARKLGLADKIPAARRQRATQTVTLAAAVFLDPQGRTLLVRNANGDGALFSNMWQFPAVGSKSDSAKDLKRYLRQNIDPKLRAKMTPLGTLRHTVTFRDIRIEPYLVPLPHLPKSLGARTPRLGHFGSLPVSNATRKIEKSALAHLAAAK
jgi:A/G-specific adenine glycosylase